MLGHFPGICPEDWPLLLAVIVRIDNARWGLSPAQYQTYLAFRSPAIPASLCLLSLPHLHANPTGTAGPARILRISPRLPPYQPTRHLSRSKCGGLLFHLPRSFSLLRIPPHLNDSRTPLHIESSYSLTDKQSSACLVKHISHSDAPVLSSHWISLSHRHFSLAVPSVYLLYGPS